VAFSVIIL